MSVAAAAFKHWASTVDLPSAALPLARAIGVSRTTVQAQLLRGRVRENVVVAAARAVGMEPVVALSSFDEYAELHDSMRPPLPVEVLSQVTLTDALIELLRRRSPAALSGVHVWEDPPQPDGLRTWIDAWTRDTFAGTSRNGSGSLPRISPRRSRATRCGRATWSRRPASPTRH